MGNDLCGPRSCVSNSQYAKFDATTQTIRIGSFNGAISGNREIQITCSLSMFPSVAPQILKLNVTS